MKAARPGRRRRAWIALAVALVVVGGVGAFLLWRGARRSGLLDRAGAALRAGDRRSAERSLRALLAVDPANRPARAKLLEVLLDEERWEEAEAATAEAEAHPDTAAWARRLAVDVSLRRHRFAEAERRARALVGDDPVHAHVTLLRLRDAVGSADSRIASAQAAVAVSPLVGDPSARAEILLHAAETLLDLRSRDAEHAQMLARHAARYVEQGGRAIDAAKASGRDVRLLDAWVRLLSPSVPERVDAAKSLSAAIAGAEAPPDLRAALAAHHVRVRDWPSAETAIRGLSGAPVLLRLRAVRRWHDAGGDRATTVAFLAEQLAGHPLAGLLRGRLLLEGSPEERGSGRDLLARLARDEDVDVPVRVEASWLLWDGSPETAGMLQDLAADHPDLRIDAFLAGAHAAAPSREEGVRSLAMLAARRKTPAESIDVLRLLRRTNPDTLDAYLAQPIDASTPEGANQRLLRAFAAVHVAVSEPDAEGADRLRRAAVEDLEAVREAPEVSAHDLATAWPLCLLVGRHDSAGALAARALSAPEPPSDTAGEVLAVAARTKDPRRRAEFAEGMRASAAPGGPRAFLDVLAEAVRGGGDPRRLLDGLSESARSAPSAVPSLSLSVRLALDMGDLDRAERDARTLVLRRPESPDALDRLGDVLLRRKAYEEVLVLRASHAKDWIPAVRQRATALWETGRRDEAVVAAREGHRAAPESVEGHLLLARLLALHDREDEALAVASAAPRSPRVDAVLARLLADRGEVVLAETVYERLARARGDDVEAWKGWAVTLAAQGRHEEVREVTSRSLGSASHDPSVTAELLVLRGAASEADERPAEALVDYERAVSLSPTHVTALNNAAWILLRHAPGRLADATAYVERALALAPSHPSVLDTAAAVYLEGGRREAALEMANRALRDRPKPSYMLRRARILLAMDRHDDAREELRRVLERAAPGTPEAKEADELLRVGD